MVISAMIYIAVKDHSEDPNEAITITKYVSGGLSLLTVMALFLSSTNLFCIYQIFLMTLIYSILIHVIGCTITDAYFDGEEMAMQTALIAIIGTVAVSIIRLIVIIAS